MSAEVGGAAVIVVDDAAKDIAALDRASVLGLSVGDGATLVDALMRASNVVITVGELAQHPLEMGLVENEEMVEAFFSDGTHPSFSEGICIGSLKGSGENVEAFADKDGIESIRVLAIVVADEESQSGLGIITSHRICLACCVTQARVGLAVTPARCTRRVPISMKKSTYRVWRVIVSTVKKSQARSWSL
jgi:hypothetical protein